MVDRFDKLNEHVPGIVHYVSWDVQKVLLEYGDPKTMDGWAHRESWNPYPIKTELPGPTPIFSFDHIYLDRTNLDRHRQEAYVVVKVKDLIREMGRRGT